MSQLPLGSKSILPNGDLQGIGPFQNRYSKIQAYGPGISGVQIANRLYQNKDGYRSVEDIYAPDESFARKFKDDVRSGKMHNVNLID